MARNSYGGTTHSVTATGSNSGSQVSVTAWNADHIKLETGMLGFTKQSATISTNAIASTGTLIEIQTDGTLNTITPTDANEFDLIYLIAKSTATSVTITHDASGGAGKIRLLSGANETLSTTTPMILMCRTISSAKEWSQYGGGIVNALNDIGDVNITSVANEDVLAYDSTTSKWINQSADETGRVTADSTTTFTNKTIDQDGTGNSITNLANASIKASAAIDATKIANGTVTSAEFQYLGDVTSLIQAQIDSKSATAGSSSIVTVGALDSGSITSGFGNINTGSSTITTTGAVATGAITAGGTITGNLTGNVTGNTSGSSGSTTGNAATVTTNADLTGDVTSSGNATTYNNVIPVAKGGTTLTGFTAGDILYASSTTQLAKLAKGTASQTLKMKSDATLPEWVTVTSGADTPWNVVHDFAGYYYDMTVQTKPANPAVNAGRFYVKEIDTNNDGLFCILRKNGTEAIEVQIV